MIFEANGAKFFAENDMIITWVKRTGHQFEPSTTAWLTERLQSASGIYLDIGAATGWFAIPAALMGVQVVAIEANPRVQKRLVANAELNGVDIEMVFAAASDKPGKVTFTYNPRLELTSGGSLEPRVSGNIASEECEAVTVDDVIGDRDVSFIKIDVEGHELPVLRGAATTIARCRPYMVLEANTGHHVTALNEWAAANGYETKQVDKRNLLCSPKF